MRRQRRGRHYADGDELSSSYSNFNGYDTEIVQMENLLSRSQMAQHKLDNTIEAKVQEGDTLQALALRFHCTVADIKRLNKIDKENEIHAHRVIKIPLTVHSVLLETLPIVHKSGNSSPRYSVLEGETLSAKIQGSLQDAKIVLEEKLLVASVNAAGNTSEIMPDSLNFTNLSSRQRLRVTSSENDPQQQSPSSTRDISADIKTPLLDDLLDESVPHPRPIRGPTLSAIDWSGTDCDMSWVCLFVVILALCFVIPLLYVLYLAEHQHQHHNNTTTH